MAAVAPRPVAIPARRHGAWPSSHVVRAPSLCRHVRRGRLLLICLLPAVNTCPDGGP
jgi:hypothetical protein